MYVNNIDVLQLLFNSYIHFLVEFTKLIICCLRITAIIKITFHKISEFTS